MAEFSEPFFVATPWASDAELRDAIVGNAEEDRL